MSANVRAPSASYVATLVVATALLGSTFVAGKVLVHAVAPFPLVGWRFVVAAGVLFVAAALTGRLHGLVPASPRDAAVVAAIGLLQTGIVMALLFESLRTIGASEAAILLFSNPIWVAVAGARLLGERLTAPLVTGLVLGIAGVALVVGPVGGRSFGGELLALGASFAFASATLTAKRFPVALSSLAVNFWQMLVGGLAVLALASATGQRWPASLSIADWLWFLWLAGPASALAFALWFSALSRGGATRTSSFLFLVPLATAAIAWAALGERIGPAQVAGGVCVGVALVLINRG